MWCSGECLMSAQITVPVGIPGFGVTVWFLTLAAVLIMRFSFLLRIFFFFLAHVYISGWFPALKYLSRFFSCL